MPRPQVNVNITEGIARRGPASDTGTLFVVHSAGAATTADPVEVTSLATITDVWGTTAPVKALATLVGDAFRQGVPRAVLVKATGTGGATPTQEEYAAALDRLTLEFGPGQVVIPGVFTPAAHSALLDHAVEIDNRTVLLDAEKDATAEELLTLAETYAESEAAHRATVVAGWVRVSAGGGASREVPASLIAAGLAARGDAARGHANHAPIFDAGEVTGGLGVVTSYTNAQLDALHDAGVSVIRPRNGVPTLTGWVSLAVGTVFAQLGVGRLTAQIATNTRIGLERYLGANVDGLGKLYGRIEGSLRGDLATLYSLDALYGATPDDAFDVEVAEVNTPADVAAGRIIAAVAITPSRAAEQIVVNVVVNLAGAAA